jgi:hypothetical protein
MNPHIDILATRQECESVRSAIAASISLGLSPASAQYQALLMLMEPESIRLIAQAHLIVVLVAVEQIPTYGRLPPLHPDQPHEFCRQPDVYDRSPYCTHLPAEHWAIPH